MNMKESTYHYHASKGEEDKDRDLKQEILNIFKESRETYGYRRVHLVLKNKGYLVNHKKVLRIMRDLNLKCTKFKRRSRKYSSYKGEVGKIADNLIQRQFSASRAKEKLCTDVTEMKCKDGEKLYLSPIIDLYNSEIIAYGVNNSPTFEMCYKPLKECLKKLSEDENETILHSDQGWQYQHKSWTNLLEENNIKQSMSRKGNCLDNSPIENFFGILKQEMYYGEKLLSYEELKDEVIKYIEYYNNVRVKERLNGMSPVQYREHITQLIA